MPNRIWEIYIANSSKKYKTINFNRALETDSPQTFSAKVAYDETINFWDLVEIKRDGTTEFKGYVESIEIDWGSQDRYLNISGRDVSVILWRKYGEGFTDMDEDLGGFFGKVGAVELLSFLFRCPQSDPVSTYPNNKAGWGMDASRLTVEAARTAYGDISWTILRRHGLGWVNDGDPFNSGECLVDAIICGTPTTSACNSSLKWEATGTDPYLNIKDDDSYIYSSTDTAVCQASFGNLPTNAGGINKVDIGIWWRPFRGFRWEGEAKTTAYIWVQSEQRWYAVAIFQGRGSPYFWVENPWRYGDIDITNILTTVDDVNNAKIKFVNQSNKTMYITQTSLKVNYVTIGTQTTDDWVDISFGEETVTGMYFESRMIEDGYPLNYDIVTILGNIPWDTGWYEVDPNNHISLNTEKTVIYHDNYHGETAYYYYDYGAGGVDSADWRFSLNITSSQSHSYAYIPFCFGTDLENLYTQYNTASHYFIALCVNDDNGTLTLDYTQKDSGGIGTGTSLTIALNTTYFARFIKSGQNWDIYIYSDASMNETYLLKHWSDTNDGTLRYRYQALTWGNLEYALRFSYGFEELPLPFTRYGGTATTALDTSDYMEGVQSFKITATADQDYYLEEEVDPTNECYTDFYVKLPVVPSEAVDRDDPDDGVPYGNGMEVDSWVEDGIDGDTLIWSKTGTAPYLNDYGGGEENLIYATAYPEDIGYYKDYWTFGDLDAKYQAILRDLGNSGGGHPYCRLRIYAKLYDGTDGHATSIDFRVRIWVSHSSSWETLGNAICNSTAYQIAEFNIGPTLTTLADWNAVKIKIDVSAIADGGSHSPAEIDKGGIKITYAVVGFKGTAYWGRVDVAKIYDKDVNGIDNKSVAIHGALQFRVRDVTTNQDKWWWVLWGHSSGYWEEVSTDQYYSAGWHRVMLEVYNNASGFVKGYEVQGGVPYLRISKTAVDTTGNGTPDCFNVEAHCTNSASGVFNLDLARWYSKFATHSNGEIDSTGFVEQMLAHVTNNTFRDCIHSWQPQKLNNIRIKITANAARSWSITQIYVYYAPPLKYSVCIDAGVTEPNPPPPYQGGPYIKSLSFDYYSTPIGPLNIAMERLIDSINNIVSKCHNNYESYKWWMAYDNDNTVYFKNRRGSDKSSTISFVKGTNLGGVTRTKNIESTVQRVKIIGRGEGKRQEDVSSDWHEDENAMDEIRGFYEDVETEKVQANKELADLSAQIKLKKDAYIEDQSVIKINKDDYASMAYDVGDDVTITDSLTGLSGAKRIYNISKDIDENGENITLVIGKAWKTQEDEWADIYRRLKELGIVGTVANDWAGEGTEEKEIDVMQMTTLFQVTAKNMVVPAEDKEDVTWWTKTLGDAGGDWNGKDDNMVIYGPSSGTGGVVVEMKKARKIEGVPQGATVETVYDPIEISLSKNPKFTADLVVWERLNGDFNNWNDGDYVEIGLYMITNETNATGYGFIVKIVKEGGAHIAYAVARTAGGEEFSRKLGLVDESNYQTEAGFKKYKVEIITDKKSSSVTINLWDVAKKTKYPVSAVFLPIHGVDTSLTVRPIYAKAYGTGGTNLRCIAMFFDVKCEYEEVKPE